MYYKKNHIITMVFFLGISTTMAAMENNEEYTPLTTIFTYPNGIKYTGMVYRKDGRPCDEDGQFLVEYQVKKKPSRKKQHTTSGIDNPKYKKLASKLKTVTYYHEEFQKLHKATLAKKLGQERSAQETKYFNTLVEQMNNENLNNTDFLIKTIFFGTKTSIEGNNETLENGIRDRLAEIKKSLEIALQRLQKGEDLSPASEKKLCDSSK